MSTSSSKQSPSSQSRHPKTKWQRVMAIARLMVYCIFAFTLLGVAAARSAYGDFKESALIAGRQLAAMGVMKGRHQRVRLNGQLVHFASALTDKPVSEVLDRIEQACRDHAATLGPDLPIESSSAATDEPSEPGIGVLREDGSEEGWVGCLWQSDDKGWESLPARVHRFSQSGDLSDIGDLRYVYARRKGTKTHVIAVWTDGPFHILKAFSPPDHQDTPGSDTPHVPRPTNSQRLLTAQVEGAPYSVRIYDANTPADQMLKMYDETMPKMGWKPVAHASDDMPAARVYSRNNVDVLLLTVPKDDRTFVSIVEMLPH